MPIKNTFAQADKGNGESQAAEAPKTSRRRSKAELIDAAVVPSPTDKVKVKFKATGTSGEREWSAAVELFNEDKIEFTDKSMKYAILKMERDADKPAGDEAPSVAAAPEPVSSELGEKLDALEARWVAIQSRIDAARGDQEIRDLSAEAEKVREEIMGRGAQDPASDAAYERREKGEKLSSLPVSVPNNVPLPDSAELGDEIVVNGDTSYLGHGHVMTNMPPNQDNAVVEANGRWAMTDSGWDYTDLKKERVAAHASEEGFHDPAGDEPQEGDRSIAQAAAKAAGVTKGGEENAQGDLVVQREPVGQGAELVDVNLGLWKVSMGYLEKIGLPDYSSLQIGPASAQRHVLDDGRRIKVAMHGREVEIPAAVVESMAEAAQVCEYVMRAERQAMINFLEAVKPGSTKS